MNHMDYSQAAKAISEVLRLKTFPIAVKFLESAGEFPEKTRQPSEVLGKRITLCQAVTMARIYGWTVGLTKADLICVPAMIAFGYSSSPDPGTKLGELFCEVDFAGSQETAKGEIDSMSRLENDQNRAIILAPLFKGVFEPDTIAVYANPAQVMRMVQAIVYIEGRRIRGNFGGKVECTEYLLAPYLSGNSRVAIPGMGDRIFSMTQDDEMVLALTRGSLKSLIEGLPRAGKAIGARYPVTFYQNFEPEFPKQYGEAARELGLFE